MFFVENSIKNNKMDFIDKNITFTMLRGNYYINNYIFINF